MTHQFEQTYKVQLSLNRINLIACEAQAVATLLLNTITWGNTQRELGVNR